MNHFFQENYATLERWALQITAYDRGLAGDILHDAFLRFHKTPKASKDDVKNLDGYVYTALRNSYRTHLRKNSRRMTMHPSVFDVESVNPEMIANDPLIYMRTKEDLQAVCEFACKRKDTSTAASILILRFFHGYFPAEISRLLNRSRNAVEMRLVRIRREAIDHLSGKKQVVRRERRTFIGSRSETVDTDLMTELQRTIFANVSGECFPKDRVKRMYRKDAPGPDRDEIGHLVSCRSCLDTVSKMLRLPGLYERHPFDALGAQSTVDSLHIGRSFFAGFMLPAAGHLITAVLTISENFARLVS